ncbi:MAG: hypothetical protein V3W41_22085 [Planctomycetota bacterium]
MGLGFPTRPTRLAFGPLAYQNRFEPQEPGKEIGKTIFNGSFWQIAGMGVMSFRAFAAFDVTGAGAVAATPEVHAEAWDPEAGVAPALAKQATGQIRLTYAATYPDETGDAQATALGPVMATVMITAGAALLYHATAQTLASLREVDVFIFNAANPPVLADPINQRVAVWIM